MNVRLTHIDGKLPNLALMKLSHWHKANGNDVIFSKRVTRDLLEPDFDRVYGSAIFSHSAEKVKTLCANFPGAIVGGTWNPDQPQTVEEMLSVSDYEHYDYSIYPGFVASIGFTQRGCRLKCRFCVVPKKEGKPRSVNTIENIWRGPGHPKQLHLLDNDFFGAPGWQDRIDEIIEGEFKVCFNQGINIRMIDPEVAEALSNVDYRDDSFKKPRLYTAWDNIGDEGRFFRGVNMLEHFGIPPTHLLVYMLVGYDPKETWQRIMYRFERMVDRGIRPYPMVYGDRHRTVPLGGHNGRLEKRTLGEFQRWVVGRFYTVVPFQHYDVSARGRPEKRQIDAFAAA